MSETPDIRLYQEESFITYAVSVVKHKFKTRHGPNQKRRSSKLWIQLNSIIREQNVKPLWV